MAVTAAVVSLGVIGAVTVTELPTSTALLTAARQVNGSQLGTATINPATSLSGTASTMAITLSWTPSTSPYVGCQQVQRATSSSGPWSTIATVSNNTTATYTDTTAPSGTAFYYQVVAGTAGCHWPTTGPTSTLTHAIALTIPVNTVSVAATELQVSSPTGPGLWGVCGMTNTGVTCKTATSVTGAIPSGSGYTSVSVAVQPATSSAYPGYWGVCGVTGSGTIVCSSSNSIANAIPFGSGFTSVSVALAAANSGATVATPQWGLCVIKGGGVISCQAATDITTLSGASGVTSASLAVAPPYLQNGTNNVQTVGICGTSPGGVTCKSSNSEFTGAIPNGSNYTSVTVAVAPADWAGTQWFVCGVNGSGTIVCNSSTNGIANAIPNGSGFTAVAAALSVPGAPNNWGVCAVTGTKAIACKSSTTGISAPSI